MLTRRQLLERGAVGGTAVALSHVSPAAGTRAVVGATPRLRKWVEPLAVPPVLDGQGRRQELHDRGKGIDVWKFHPSLPATQDLGLLVRQPRGGLAIPRTDDRGDAATERHRGHVRDRRVAQRARQRVPSQRPHAHGGRHAGGARPIVTHLHGGENHPQFDGTPLQWFTRGGAKGPHYITNTFTYYNEQRASMVWYHDHALGNTRTNVYAGLAGAYIIRDDQDTGEPATRSGCPPGRTRSRSCCRTRRSTPTGACSTRRRA